MLKGPSGVPIKSFLSSRLADNILLSENYAIYMRNKMINKYLETNYSSKQELTDTREKRDRVNYLVTLSCDTCRTLLKIFSWPAEQSCFVFPSKELSSYHSGCFTTTSKRPPLEKERPSIRNYLFFCTFQCDLTRLPETIIIFQ